jgi:hypothetical protein
MTGLLFLAFFLHLSQAIKTRYNDIKIYIIFQVMHDLFFSTVSRPALGPIQPPIQWVLGALSLGVKRKGREADHLPPSSAEVNNGGDIHPLPIRPHGIMLN